MDSGLKRVMVTGGAGYVGSSLVPKLLDAGHGLTVYDINEPAVRAAARTR